MAYTNIDDPSAHFTTTLWTGSGSSPRAITNDANSGNFQPDFVWTKGRNEAYEHQLYDSSRGTGESKGLTANDNSNEGYVGRFGYLSSFDSNGFTGTAGSASSIAYFNNSSKTYAAWQWKANGGTTVSNTDGDITSTVQVNQDAGFSIITYTGSGTTNDTIGHGLGEEPDIAIFKRRDVGNGNWDLQENSGKSGPLSIAFRHTLNLTEGIATNVLSSFSNTTIGLSTGGDAQKNVSGSKYVCYAFKGKQGYSKFGTYYGNSSTDGKFVYLGFKPALVIFKVLSDPNHGWSMIDNKRSPFNLMNDDIFANSNAAEVTNQNKIDFLSNGFKCRGSTYPANQGGTNTYSYFAWAENPFVTSTGVPTTAR
jgi:hypothetical protein